MARIRTLKPEILSDERTAALSDGGFRLFVALITLADDHGNTRASVPWLTGQVWWARGDSPRVAEILGELTEVGLVAIYTVRNQAYCHLNGWEKHQRIDNAGKPQVPLPAEADESTSHANFEIRGEPPRLAAGREGKGREGSGDPAASQREAPALEFAQAAIGELNRLTGKNYQPEAKPVQADCRKLAALGHTPDEAIAVVRAKHAAWSRDAKMADQLKPSVLLRPSNFARYLVEDVQATRPSGASGSGPHGGGAGRIVLSPREPFVYEGMLWQDGGPDGAEPLGFCTPDGVITETIEAYRARTAVANA